MLRYLKRFVSTIGAVALTCCAISAGPSSASETSGPIKIGSVLSLTGPASYIGEPMHQTLEMYIDKTNAEGGILGRKLQLIQYDDGSDAAKSNSFAKRLIEEDKVDAIIAGNTSGATMAMLPLVQSAGIPFFSLAGSVAIVEPVKNWIFKTPPTDRMMAQSSMEGHDPSGSEETWIVDRNGRIRSVSQEGESGPRWQDGTGARCR
jgi:branched-chain amino acid transport system substrate-binding protein